MTKIFIRLSLVLLLTVVLVGCTETSFTEPISSSMSTTGSMPITSTSTQAITTSSIQTSTASTVVSTTQTTTAAVTSQMTSTTIPTTTHPTTVTTSPSYQEFSLINGTPFTLVNFNPLATHTAYSQEFINDELHIVPTKFHKLDQLTMDLSQMNLSSTKKLIITAKGDGMMMIKLSSTIFIEPGKDTIVVPLSMFETTFEFNLDFQNYDQVRNTLQSITIIFGSDVNELSSNLSLNPPVHAFTTEIVITKFAFSEEPARPDYTFNVRGSVTDPNSLINLPNINLMDGWLVNEADTYVISRTENNLSISSTLSKPVWGFVYFTLEGYLKNYSVISITVSGTPGIAFKMKLEGAGITTIETGSTVNGNILDPVLSATSTTYTWIISPANMTAGEAIRLLIFLEPGVVGSGASMVITNFELKTIVAD